MWISNIPSTILPKRDESSIFLFSLLWHHLIEGRWVREGVGLLFQSGKVGSHQLLLASVGPQFCLVFGWYKAVIFRKFSLLLCCPLPGPLAREIRLFSGLFFFSVPIGMFGSLTSLISILEYTRQKDHQKLTTGFLQVPSFLSWSVFSPPFILLCLFLYMSQGFKIVLRGRDWKNISTTLRSGSLLMHFF